MIQIKHESCLKPYCKCVLWQNLKDGEERLGEIIKCAASCLIKVELSTEELHSKQTEDDNEEEEQQ